MEENLEPPLKKAKRGHKRKKVKALQDERAIPRIQFVENNHISDKCFRQLIQSIYEQAIPKAPFNVMYPQNIPKIVFCSVGGITRDDFGKQGTSWLSSVNQNVSEKFPFIAENFQEIVFYPNEVQGSSIGHHLNKTVKLSLSKEAKEAYLKELKQNKITINDLLVPLETMKGYDFPIHSMLVLSDIPEGWVETTKFEHVGSHIFGLDCEFCESANGKELTRISLVDFTGAVVLDSYVQPLCPITDYKTKYSGITAGHLEGVTTSLQDIQKKLTELVSSDDILVGHSIESDLRVLRLRHPRIVDTAICYHHHMGPPARPALKWLTLNYLNKQIQQGEATGVGHSSIEDASACIDLVKLKIQEGSAFGLKLDSISIIKAVNEFRQSSKEPPIAAAIIDYHDRFYETCGMPFEAVTNDDEAVNRFLVQLQSKDILFVNLRELESSLGWLSPCHVNHDVETARTKLNGYLLKIYSALPENSVFIVSSIYGCNKLAYKEAQDQAFATRKDPSKQNDSASAKKAVKGAVLDLKKSFAFIKTKN